MPGIPGSFPIPESNLLAESNLSASEPARPWVGLACRSAGDDGVPAHKRCGMLSGGQPAAAGWAHVRATLPTSLRRGPPRSRSSRGAVACARHRYHHTASRRTAAASTALACQRDSTCCLVPQQAQAPSGRQAPAGAREEHDLKACPGLRSGSGGSWWGVVSLNTRQPDPRTLETHCLFARAAFLSVFEMMREEPGRGKKVGG